MPEMAAYLAERLNSKVMQVSISSMEQLLEEFLQSKADSSREALPLAA